MGHPQGFYELELPIRPMSGPPAALSYKCFPRLHKRIKHSAVVLKTIGMSIERDFVESALVRADCDDRGSYIPLHGTGASVGGDQANGL